MTLREKLDCQISVHWQLNMDVEYRRVYQEIVSVWYYFDITIIEIIVIESSLIKKKLHSTIWAEIL